MRANEKQKVFNNDYLYIYQTQFKTTLKSSCNKIALKQQQHTVMMDINVRAILGFL